MNKSDEPDNGGLWAAVVTLFPEMLEIFTGSGVLAQAVERGALVVEAINPRDFADDRHGTVDDAPYGGGPGMVMKVAPLAAAIERAQEQAMASTGARARVIYLSPQGPRLDQARVRQLSEASEPLVLVAGRYEAVDERLIEANVDEQLSVGDFVLTGGELPAMIVLDAVCRLQRDMIGNRDSLLEESFEDDLLDHPHYTRPEVVSAAEVVSEAEVVPGSVPTGQARAEQVPAALMSGDHARINEWRRKMRLAATYERRPDLLTRKVLTEQDRELLRQWLIEAENGP